MTLVRTTIVGAAIAGLLAAGCSPSDPQQLTLQVDQPTGSGVLANYVAIGDGLMAGFMDGGLIATATAPSNGQFASVPFQIAGKLGYTGTGGSHPFYQPLVGTPGLGSADTGDPAVVAGVLYFDTVSQEITLRGTTPRDQVPSLLLASAVPVPYNNLGVPGAVLLDVSQALDSMTSAVPDNSFFDVVLRNPTFGDVTMRGQAAARGPTLVTVWIGEGDAINGARTGSPVLGTNVTPGPAFSALLTQLVNDLQALVNTRYGYDPTIIVATVPPLELLPYFVPKAVFDTVVGATIPTAETGVTYVLFPTLADVQDPGFTPPIPATSTLTASEAAVVSGALADYNTAIMGLDALPGVTVVDVAALLGAQAQANPATVTHFLFLLGQGATVSQAAAATLFSLDGLHLNSHGYSLVANAFIDAINAELALTGADVIAHVDPALSWDPTYAVGGSPAAAGAAPRLSAAAAAALRGMQR